jgi:uncharacterized protein YecE (DUF72 family)
MARDLHPLTYISEFFDTVEVNTTFYRPPDPRYGMSWVAKVAHNPRFKFTLKLWQRFTHERDAWPTADEVRAVTEGIQPLADAGKLGAMLVQFPWSFKRTPENRQWLARVLDTFGAYPLALEIRHASWDVPEVYDSLAERHIAFCNIDQPQFHDSIAPSTQVTARVGYVRLHGRNYKDWFRDEAGRDERYDYLYSAEELKPWVAKIERMRQQAEEVYAITNNHYRGQAVVNAFEIQAELGQDKPSPPSHLVEAYPQLRVLEKR